MILIQNGINYPLKTEKKQKSSKKSKQNHCEDK